MKVTPVRILQAVLPILVLAASGFGARALIASRPKPPKKPPRERAVVVEVASVEQVSRPAIVRGSGTVTPAYQVELAAEVGGRVVWKHPQLTLGGLVNEGETLVRIDGRDYKLDLQQQEAAVHRARTELELEEGRGRVAAQEWQMFGGGEGASEDLATRAPQQRAAELGLLTAESGLEQARLKLGRTTLKAPFDAVVRTNATEVGRLVTPQQSLATLVNSSVFLAVISLPVEDLAWLKIPGTSAPPLTQDAIKAAYAAEDPTAAFAKLASLARITQKVGKQEIERTGIAVRIVSELDPVGRMVRLLVSIQDPLGRKLPYEDRRGASGLPILLGAYVNVELQGEPIENVIEVPRVALRDGSRVYVYADGRLDVRDVEVVRREADSVLVGSGLAAGERVIISNIPSPVPGIELRIAGDREGKPTKPQARAQASAARDRRREERR